MIRLLKQKIELYFFRRKWRRENQHNKITPCNKFPIKKVTVGKNSYGPIIVKSWDHLNERLEIGNVVSIAEGVKFILGGNHEINTFSTFPFKVMCLNEKAEAWTKGPIVIEDDVWIGMDSLILSGIRIGQGAIIGARSVVTKDIPPYAIVGGNPAKIIKYRYSEEIIKEMIKFDWGKIKESKVKKLREELYKPLTLELVKKIKKEFGEN